MKRPLPGLKNKIVQLWFVLLIFFILGMSTYFILKSSLVSPGLLSGSSLQTVLFTIVLLVTIVLPLSILLFLFASYFLGKHAYQQTSATSGNGRALVEKNRQRSETDMAFINSLKAHLYRRFGLFWRRKVRLLLLIGEEHAIDALVPGLPEKRWLEGHGTVLIYAGSPEQGKGGEKYGALRKLRCSRPLEGIVRVINVGQDLSLQVSDSDLRGLEKIGEALRYQPPVWLWQLCDSGWSQAGRASQAVGIALPQRATPNDVVLQLNKLLPQLREQGLAQMANNQAHDFLLRLAQQLEQGGSERWKARLAPWLWNAQRRVPLRGLMFSLWHKPASQSEEMATSSPHSDSVSEPLAYPHALILSPIWQGITTDCRHVSGRRVGVAWQQGLGWGAIAIAGLWCVGLLLSFTFNYRQIATVADRAHLLVAQPAISDAQLIALHALSNDIVRLQHGAPWYQRFGLDRSTSLLNATLPWYGIANNRLIRDPASAALKEKLADLVAPDPDNDRRVQLVKPGYDQLKAWLMMARPDKGDRAFYVQTMKAVQPARSGISSALWQSLSPDLWAFYITMLPQQPQWKIGLNSALVSQSRQVLLQQTDPRRTEDALYEKMLKSVSRNFADVSLEDMAGGTDVRKLFITDEVVPGVFTRQAWEGGIQQFIDAAVKSRRDETDWVFSDSGRSVSTDLTPGTLKARLIRRYFTDFSASWLSFLNSFRLTPANSIDEVTGRLMLMGDERQSPLMALMKTLAWQGQTSPAEELDKTFGPLLILMGKGSEKSAVSANSSLSLQTYLTRITRLRLRLQRIAGAANQQQMMQTLAQTVFQGKSVDLTDTQQYGSLVAASLGEGWRSFGSTVFIQPLTQAWKTVLEPSAANLNARWEREMVANWHKNFNGRYPFTISENDASLPELAAFIRQDTGLIDRFLSTELGGVLAKKGNRWVPNEAHSQGMVFNPLFLRAVNQLSQLADTLFSDGNQGVSFALRPQPAPQIVATRLTIDGQSLHYFNQMAEWRSLRWPGETYRPGTMLTWASTRAGTQLFGDYSGTWGFIRWLEQGKRQQTGDREWMISFTTPDGQVLGWALRTSCGDGPLALLELRGFSLPTQIFSVKR